MRTGLWIAGAAVALAAVGYTGAWFYGANRLEREIAAWKDEAEGNGVSITHDEVEIGGFPLGLTAVIPDLQIRNEAEGASIEAVPSGSAPRSGTPITSNTTSRASIRSWLCKGSRPPKPPSRSAPGAARSG